MHKLISMNLQRRRLSLGCLLFVTATTSLAQAYPSRVVHVVVPFGPGTGADLSARILTEHLSRSMGQTFVVENRVGAGGAIGTASVAAAAPDGYTLLMNASSHSALPAYKILPFDARRDFVGIAAFGVSPMVLVVSKEKGWRSVKDLVAAAKARPGSLSFASAGIGSTTHLSGEKFCLDAGFRAVHVPYKSTTDAIADLITGRVDFLITSVPPTLGPLKNGRLIALAMGSKRSSALPDVPTFAEAGVREAETWFGLFAPAKTPIDIVQRLHVEVQRAAEEPSVQDRLAKMGAEPARMSMEEFNAKVKREIADNEQLVKAIGLKPE